MKLFYMLLLIATCLYLLFFRRSSMKAMSRETFIIAIAAFILGFKLFIEAVLINPNELRGHIYALASISSLAFGFVFFNLGMTWRIMNEFKEQIRLRFDSKIIKQIITAEVNKQIPDLDKIFEHYKIFLAVAGILFAGILTVIIFAFNIKIKP